MKLYFDTIGCRLNQSEMETMARQLQAVGHEIVTSADIADQIILNTCAVTKEATRDTRLHLRQFHRANPNAEITVTGCHATIAPNDIAILPGVRHVVSNAEKDQLLGRIDSKLADQPLFEAEPIIRDFKIGGLGHTRAFIKVQDGCKNKCTFCVTTIARGDSRSRRAADIVREIQALAAIGYREAVLTGVHLGSYGHDLGHAYGLRDLVQMILTHTEIPRLRLSSLEPWEIAPDFFQLWQNPRLLPHLHLPLQSGCDATLRRMARKTSQAAFSALVREARDQIADLSITTDLICGFPGESADEFAQSYAFVQAMNFARLHVFTYSPRPQTAAATMPNQLPNGVKKERTQQMIALGEGMSLAFHRQFIGRTLPVLWEGMVGADDHGLRWVGHSDNYIRVTGYGRDLLNQVTEVTMHTPSHEGVWAR